MHPIRTTLVAALLAASGASAVAGETLKATVNGMVCAFCAQGIEKRLTKLPQAQAVHVDLKRKIVAVEAKDGQTIDPKVVRAEIADAGYSVVKLEAVPQSVAEIKAAKPGR